MHPRWERILPGESAYARFQRMYRTAFALVPSPWRCKFYDAPFAPLGSSGAAGGSACRNERDHDIHQLDAALVPDDVHVAAWIDEARPSYEPDAERFRLRAVRAGRADRRAAQGPERARSPGGRGSPARVPRNSRSPERASELVAAELDGEPEEEREGESVVLLPEHEDGLDWRHQRWLRHNRQERAAIGAFLRQVVRTSAAAGASYPARPPISAFRIADSTSAARCPSASPPKRDERAASDGSEGGAVDRSHKLDLTRLSEAGCG